MMNRIGGIFLKKTIVVIAHPEIENSTVQQFLLEGSQKLQNVESYILKETKMDVYEERRKLKEFDRIIFQFPMYWYSAPADLKRWIDDIFSMEFAENELQGKELGLVVSLGLSEKNFASGMSERYTLSEIFRPFEALANKCRMIFLPIFPISLFSYLKENERKRLLIQYEQYLTKENITTFESQENWFKEKIYYLISTDIKIDEKEKLNNILNVMEENRDNLEDLLVLVKEMRLDE